MAKLETRAGRASRLIMNLGQGFDFEGVTPSPPTNSEMKYMEKNMKDQNPGELSFEEKDALVCFLKGFTETLAYRRGGKVEPKHLSSLLYQVQDILGGVSVNDKGTALDLDWIME